MVILSYACWHPFLFLNVPVSLRPQRTTTENNAAKPQHPITPRRPFRYARLFIWFQKHCGKNLKKSPHWEQLLWSLENDYLNNRLARPHSHSTHKAYMFSILITTNLLRKRQQSQPLPNLKNWGSMGFSNVNSPKIIGGQWRFITCMDFMCEMSIWSCPKILWKAIIKRIISLWP